LCDVRRVAVTDGLQPEFFKTCTRVSDYILCAAGEWLFTRISTTFRCHCALTADNVTLRGVDANGGADFFQIRRPAAVALPANAGGRKVMVLWSSVHRLMSLSLPPSAMRGSQTFSTKFRRRQYAKTRPDSCRTVFRGCSKSLPET